MRERGVSRIAREGISTISLELKGKTYRSTIYKNDITKTLNNLVRLVDGIVDKLTKEEIKFCISNNWLKHFSGLDSSKNVNEEEQPTKPDISLEKWQDELVIKYWNLYHTVKERMPILWDSLEFELSVLRILNIANCTLPFAGIVLGNPSSSKTLGMEMLRKRRNAIYSDNFSAKSFVSHSANVKKEELKDIDLLPKIKNKALLTPELSPTFTKKDDDLREVLGIMTRILDGKGYESDSGVHGHRGYVGEFMFVWIGAAVDIPYNVHKILGNLGSKLYFLRIPKSNKSKDDYFIQAMADNYTNDMEAIETAQTDYLDWFEMGPSLVSDNDSGLQKIQWNNEQNDEKAIKIITELAVLLAHLRGTVTVWDTDGTQGLNYGYSTPIIEEPDRAITQLRNLARGHALSKGRNYITLDDIPMIIKVVLSTASIERVAIFDLLISAGNDGLTTLDITRGANISKPTARKIMAEFQALGIVIVEKGEYDTSEIRARLNPEYNWFLEEEFKKLRKGFNPANYIEYLKKKYKA